MRKNMVFTLTGPDRVGLVESVTKLLLDHGGNVEASRMARLGGDFAMLLLVSLGTDRLADLERGVEALTAQGFKVTTSETVPGYAAPPAGWRPFHIEVEGADHEGIIHEVARYLSEHGINIESMETGVTAAPHTGTPLFTMSAVVAVPPELEDPGWQEDVDKVGRQLNVEITLSPVK